MSQRSIHWVREGRDTWPRSTSEIQLVSGSVRESEGNGHHKSHPAAKGYFHYRFTCGLFSQFTIWPIKCLICWHIPLACFVWPTVKHCQNPKHWWVLASLWFSWSTLNLFIHHLFIYLNFSITADADIMNRHFLVLITQLKTLIQDPCLDRES